MAQNKISEGTVFGALLVGFLLGGFVVDGWWMHWKATQPMVVPQANSQCVQLEGDGFRLEWVPCPR